MKTKQVLALKPLVSALRACVGWTALPGVALAGPLGEVVQQGVVGVARPDALTTEVTQASEHAVVNWHSFSVGGQEYVKFVQPGSNAAILNRVVGGEQSSILGRIEANGRVFLVNPQGVYFGAGSRVDASGFAASALDIADEDFMAGRYVFAKGSGATGAVENHGELRGEQFVALLGERVTNAGLIEARLGTVALGAGERVTLTLDEGGLVSFAVDEATAASLAGVENTGSLVADGGRVVMSASVADGLVATAVNNAGLVRARGIEVADGGIYLRGSGGAVVNSGTLDADGVRGGVVRVTSTTDVTVTSGATVSARGEAAGGEVRLVAGEDLRVESGALVDVRSAAPGEGGLIEVSAHGGAVKVDGTIKTGDGGELVIDPARLRIDAGSGGIGSSNGVTTIAEGFIESQLPYGGLTLVASDEIFSSATAQSPITINSTGTGLLALRIGTGGLFGSSFGFDSSGAINLQHVNFNLGGAFEAQAGTTHGSVTVGNVIARDHLWLQAGGTTGNVTAGALSVSAGVPGITVSGSASIELFANSFATTNTGNVLVNGPITATTNVALRDASAWLRGRTVTVNGNTTLTAGNGGSASFDVFANNGVTINGGVTLSGVDGENSIDIFNQGPGNIFVAGALRILNGSYSSIDIFAGSGNVTLNGALDTVGSSSQIFVNGDRITLAAGARSVANASYGSASIDISARAGVDITGDLVATAGVGDDAQIFIINSNFGGPAADIVLRNALRATGGSSAGITVENYRGAVLLNGAVSVLQNDAANSFGSASLYVYGETGATLNGPVNVNAQGGYASGEVYSQGAVSVNGPFSLNAPGAHAHLYLDGASIAVRNLVSASGGSGAMIYAFSENGPLQTLDQGLLSAPSLQLGTAAGFIDVRTKASEIGISNYGSGANHVRLDNSANTGPTSIYINSYLGSGSYSSSGFGAANFPGGSSSGFVGAGAVDALFSGDVDVFGTMFAQNAEIEVTNGSLRFHDTVYIGSLNLPPDEGDALAILALSQARRPDGTAPGLPRYNGLPTTGANALFLARDGISFDGGLGFDDPDTPYVIFGTDGTLDLGPGVFNADSVGHDFLAQFTSYTPGAKIFVEDRMPLVPQSGGPTFTRLDHFSKLPGTTLIFGNAPVPPDVIATGDILIGSNGTVDIGDQNALFISGGFITGIGNLRSTGFVGELLLNLAEEINEVFPLPYVGDINQQLVDEESGEEEQEDEYVDVDGDGEGQGEELIARKSDNGQMCQ